MVFRRRRADWMADVDGAAAPVDVAEGRTADSRRAALELARATLAAQHGLTAGHSDEVGLLCEEIADELGIEGWERCNLLAAAQLHDIGKVAVPDEILDKAGALDDEEWALVREHTLVGERIVMSAPELEEVARIVRHTHENWDGSGYPDGLAGEEIPLASRVVLGVDAFHALRTDRPYRKGRSAAEAMAEMKAHAGTQFDPAVVAALEAACERVRRGGAGWFANGSHPLLRSRRVAALLLALVVGGGAFAAVRPDLTFDRDHSADASTDMLPCVPDTCPLLEFPPLRPLATRSGASPKASAAIVGGPPPVASPHAAGGTGRAHDELRMAGRIEQSPPAHRRTSHHRRSQPQQSTPHAPVTRPAPPAREAPAGAAPAPASPAPKPRKPRPSRPSKPSKPSKPPKAFKPAKRPHPESRPSAPPGHARKARPPRGNAYGHYQHERD